MGDSRPLTSIEIKRGNALMETTTTMTDNVAEYIIESIDCLYSASYQCVVFNDQYAGVLATKDVELLGECE